MEILIYIIGGFLAGLATGLIGLSAATIIAPLFATILGMDPYIAIGIALVTDVFASGASTVIYYKNKNIDLKSASILAIIVVAFTVLGSYLSSNTNPYNLNSALNIFVIVLGFRFLIYPVKNRESNPLLQSNKAIIIQTVIWGIVIGLISGWFGAGGGLSILAVLTMLLHYGLKKAVGTSVFIMTFTALVGAITHILIGGTLLLPLIIASASAFIGANIASHYANRVNEETLNKVIGTLLIGFGIALVLVFYI